MDISIITGTYNRLSYLKAMVNSARESIKGNYGLEYEFVIVDGNSTDGTLDWCDSQPDIRLIRHLSLLGAVKAFNDGAGAAIGDYVILANDDIEFVGNSVLLAWVYMQEHNDCGIGCFYQDRNRQNLPDNDKWHVENMPVVVSGQQRHWPYGQVCIVPRWLGDYVGWWGDYLHTYGGDNELSSQVYELGFKVSPVPGAKIHDKEPQDDLRQINNLKGAKDPRAVRGHHPDSWAWGRKWRNNALNLVGPVIKEFPILENTTPIKERVLYLPIYEVGWQVQKEQKRGLREALAKVALVKEVDYFQYASENGQLQLFSYLLDLCHQIHPTLILTQVHNAEILNADHIRRLRMSNPQARMINWNGDFWPENLLSTSGIELAKAFDLQLTINRDVLDRYRSMGVNADYWQIGYEPDGVGCEPIDKRYDVVFLGNGYSADRRKLGRFLSSLNGIKLGLYGSGWTNSEGQTTYDFKAGCRIYQAGKISIGDSQWPDTGFVSNRIFQALAAGGAALAHEWFKDMDKLGLIDSETCIIWRSHHELEDKIRHYLNHEDERRRIAEAGQRMCLERHSFDVRVSELFEMLEMEKADHWRY